MLDTVGPGQMLLADRAYDSNGLRRTLAERGATANIKPLRHRLSPPPFSAAAVRSRNLIERFFGKLKHFPAIATRYKNKPPTLSLSSNSRRQNLKARYTSVA